LWIKENTEEKSGENWFNIDGTEGSIKTKIVDIIPSNQDINIGYNIQVYLTISPREGKIPKDLGDLLSGEEFTLVPS